MILYAYNFPYFRAVFLARVIVSSNSFSLGLESGRRIYKTLLSQNKIEKYLDCYMYIFKLVQRNPITRFDGISVRKDITRLASSDKVVKKN